MGVSGVDTRKLTPIIPLRELPSPAARHMTDDLCSLNIRNG